MPVSIGVAGYLRDHAGVYTESSGEGKRRKIQILPKRI